MFALVAKELTEQANRKRTYALRMLVAVVLGLAFMLQYLEMQQFDEYGDVSASGMLGRGRVIFDALIYGCLWSVIALVPGMTAAALTEEKESGTLPLLILSRLGIRGIIMQKWLSRVISACALLLPALPLGAIAYACGGVEPWVLAYGLSLVFVTIAWTSAVSLAASAWCRTTMGAFVMAYLLIGGMCLTGLMWPVYGWESYWLCPPMHFYEIGGGRSYRWGYGGSRIMKDWAIVESMLPLAAVTMGSLIFTLLIARRRAEITGRPWILRVFAWLDRQAVSIDQRLFKRTTAVDLPVTRPVRWREVQGRSLCNWRYLLRWMLPALAVMLSMLVAGSGRTEQTAGMLIVVVIAIAMLVITVRGAGVFAGERNDQTLAVLLTTPMTPRELVRDKMIGLRRLHFAAGILVGLVLIIRAAYAIDLNYRHEWFVGLSVAEIVLLPAVTAWSAMLVGIMIHRRSWAVVTALGVLVGINIVLPFAIALSSLLVSDRPDQEAKWMITVAMGISPGLLPMLHETKGIHWSQPYEGREAVITWAITQTFLWFSLRWYTLHSAAYWLRRRA